MAIAAIVKGLEDSGVISDEAVVAIASNLAEVAEQMASYGRREYGELLQLAGDVADGRISGPR